MKKRRTLLLTALLLAAGIAPAQVLIEGNVFGGGNLGEVVKGTTDAMGNTSVIINGGTIGNKIPLADRKADATGQVTRIRKGNVYAGGNGYDGEDYIHGVPSIDRNHGRVQGNTSVIVRGGAVVRHAVYGGGNLGTVGDCTINPDDGTATYTAGGKTTVTIEGSALIGPTKADLTTATLEEIQAFFGTSATMEDLPKYIDTAFKYLGDNEGMVFGGSRGLSGDELKELSFVDTTEVIIQGSANVVGNVFGGGENGHVQKGTGVLVAGNAVIGGVVLHGTSYSIPTDHIYYEAGHNTIHLKEAENEIYEDPYGVGPRIFRGNVFGGGKGNDFVPWLLGQEPPVQQYAYTSGHVYGNATVEIKGSATVYNKVYGGGTMASVGTFTYTPEDSHTVSGIVQVGGKDTGRCFVKIHKDEEGSPTIGSPGTDGRNNGDVYGGGRGIVGKPYESGTVLPINQAIDLAYTGHSFVTIDGANILSTVYGGSANGHVQGNTKVTIKETTAGTTFIGSEGHGAWHSNVFGGGGGTARYKGDDDELHLSITSGRVFGDTEVKITGGKIWHNVYGGGAIASVGTYDASEVQNPTHPYLGGGHATVTITGGTIGSDGYENGMVFGSGRGEIAEPGNFLDYVTYVAYSEVNIGTLDGDFDDLKINGSVYGSGENGHTYIESKVNVYSGTIGCTLDEYLAMDDDEKANRFPYRGNVYGAGCGTDEYGWETLMVPGTETPATIPGTVPPVPIRIGQYNPIAGITQGNTFVNIYGGYISRSVYGGGAMASVGVFDRTEKHENTATNFALSWPYKFEYKSVYEANGDPLTTGKTEVTVTGGHIGTYKEGDLYALANSGDVYGGSRGQAGDRYVFVPLANVRETQVHIRYSEHPEGPSDDGDFIVNSVFGGGENGHVYENTTVTIDEGLIGGTAFGGGKGKDTYWDYLLVYDPEHPDPTYPLGTPTLYQLHSITAGKVFGNTEITMNGGFVQHNVFGGGEYASVGIGNYYGYGELPTDGDTIALTTTTGKATVKIYGGTIGTLGYPDTYGIGNGFVYGSSKGVSFPDVKQPTTPPTPRFDYSRDFFLGYTNETDVTIGKFTGSGTGPTIWGSVFGGGEDGHVRFATDVTVNRGTIGENYAYDPDFAVDSTLAWVYRGNVYGAGRGIDPIAGSSPVQYCSSAGSVTLNTTVTIKGGTIHRNVYGGGSMASVGPPPTGFDPGPSLCTVNIKGGSIGQSIAAGDSYDYGGDIFGASRGMIDLLTSANIGRFATSSETVVNIDSVATVKGDVYGGGEIGQVKLDALVNMKAGTVKGSVYGGGKGDLLDEKAALVLGNATVDMTDGTVERSIYGGGELGNVGTYTGYYTASEIVNTAHVLNEPKGCAENTGLATVTISGGHVGKDGSLMPGPTSNADDDDRGWVFCGGRGDADTIASPKANLMGIVGSTYLEISKTETTAPVITASVYGGCENGLVLGNTHVKIAGGQIGTGYDKDNEQWDDPYDEEDDWGVAIAAVYYGTIETELASGGSLYNKFHQCDAWPYGDGTGHYKIYDYYYGDLIDPNDPTSTYEPAGSARTGSNGHSFFGNVFGGGSGYYPIAPRVWRRSAGRVWGDTWVEITGGHILNSVYGGNETTDVMGKCLVEMSDGTVGIPRTVAQIAANPSTCYIYGAGMGDPRQGYQHLFDRMNNADSTRVVISGGYIFGSVFGGAENGHVLDSCKVVVKGGTIGITGTSGHDGLVFGGGKGDELNIDPVPEIPEVPAVPGDPPTPAIPAIPGHPNFAPGRVGGNAHVKVSQADDDIPTKILGNVYGGGCIARTGVGVSGDFEAFETLVNPGENQYYVYDSVGHGLVKVDVTGGTIGNPAKNGDILLGSSQQAGNVYGGGRGDIDEFREDDLGRSAKAIVNISGSPAIMGCVYGGGQMANVGHWNTYDTWYTKGTGLTRVKIEGSPTIGTEKEFTYDYSTTSPTNTKYDIINGMKLMSHTYTGNVFGGGQGTVKIDDDGYIVGLEQGHCRQTYVNINMDNSTSTSDGGHIRGSVFGGSEEGAVWGHTEVHIAGGTIGTDKIHYDSLKYVTDHWEFAHNDSTYSYGSVFGGSYGRDFYTNFNVSALHDPTDPELVEQAIDSVNELAGRVYGNAYVYITGGTVRCNVFGGGNMASLGSWKKIMDGDDLVDIVPYRYAEEATSGPLSVIYGDAHVTVSGGTIGPLDYTGLNAYVFGGGKGFHEDPTSLRKTYSNVANTIVTVNGGKIWGSVFGGGSDCHVLGNTDITITSNATTHTRADIGTKGITTWDGNIFGGGRNFTNTNHTNGRVRGNVTITMDRGVIQGTIFGGGRLALTGVDVNGGVDAYLDENNVYDDANHGLVTIEVSGIYDAATYSSTAGYSTSIGNSNAHDLLYGSAESVGDIFGSGKGDTKEYDDILAGRVANTIISVTGSPRIYGSVFGGGEMASVGYWHSDNHPTHPKSPFYGNTGSTQVTIGSSGENVAQSDHLLIGTDREFRYDYAHGTGTNAPSYWTVFDDDHKLIHSCTGNVYGGSQGDVDTISNHWVSMARSRTSTVTINSGTIMSRVFGGAEQGSLAGNATVVINGGTIGKLANFDSSTANQYYFGGVFGGGYGSHNPKFNGTQTSYAHTPITNDSTAYLSDDLWTADHLAGRVYGDTRVDVLGGRIQGDVFGGASFAYVGGYGNNPSGDVQVNIGLPDQTGQPIVGNATFLGSVYGANNYSGTPYGTVNVDVYHTAHTTWTAGNVSYTDYAPTLPEGLVWSPDLMIENINGTGHFDKRQGYAIKQVFGGGNNADFTPNAASRTTVPRSTTVHIHYCENTIEDLYGGGNAAAIGTSESEGTTNSNVVVDGGRFYRVFGGGNGTVRPADIHGTAKTEINAGVIQEVFGGGNHDGQIDVVDLEITHSNAYDPDDNPTGCDDFIYDVFGGTNEAEIIGDIVSVINCGDGYQYEYYGGTNNATIWGNVTTHVFGGTADFLFGGSKGRAPGTNGLDDPGVAANIRRFPTYEEIEADLEAHPGPGANDTLQRQYSWNLRNYMGYPDHFNTALAGTGGNVTLNLFGGEIKQAAFGGSDAYGNIEGQITVNVYNAEVDCELDLIDLYGAGRNTDYTPEHANIVSPQVNIINGTVKGNVYGGGMGTTNATTGITTATTTANPEVNMGYQASMATTLVPALNTAITTYSDLTPPVLANYAPYVNGNIYGGGQVAHVHGNTTVNVSAGEVGTIAYTQSNPEGPYDGINHLTGGNVFGGGKGSTTNKDDGRVHVNSTVNVSGGIVYYNVYGGGELGSVGEHTSVYNSDDELIDIAPVDGTGLATVNITGGQVGPAPKVDLEHGYNIPIGLNGRDGYVFGGGKGKGDTELNEYDLFANVNNTNVTVNISSELPAATNCLWGSVFGGAEDGHVLGDAEVHYESGLMGTTGTTTYDGNIFGGGRNYDFKNTIAGRVRGNITVEMTGGHLLGNIYGGGRLGNTGINLLGQMIADDATHNYGHTTVSVGSCEVGTAALDSENSGNVFGGGKGKSYDGIDEIWGINWNTVEPWTWADLAKVKQTQVNILDDAVVNGSVFGGGEIALVDETTEVNVNGGIIGGVSGTTSNNYGSVFGGGKGLKMDLDYRSRPKAGQVGVSTEVNMSGGQVYENVYGGGEIGSVGNYGYDESYVYDNEGFIIGYLYTGIKNVTGGTTTVNISGGEIGPVDDSYLSGYVFGGGQGVSNDASEYYKVFASVVDANVNISKDAQVDGSVLGGAAEGHVLGDVAINITGGTIGTNGYTMGDGNVMGGGGNQTLSNFSAGRVGGNIGITMSAGNVKGSIYGGGYAGLTGADEDGHAYTTDLADHGNITINITGGTIGSAIAHGSPGHGIVGNVFGSGKGDNSQGDYSTFFNGYMYGSVLNTNVNIGTGARVHGSVFGGGELSSVGSYRKADAAYHTAHPDVPVNDIYCATGGSAQVTVTGGLIGSPITGDTKNGYVYGGAKGIDADPSSEGYPMGHYPQYANVGSTLVTVTMPDATTADTTQNRIWGSVFGGGSEGRVLGNTKIVLNSGVLGSFGERPNEGNLFGAGRNDSGNNPTMGRVAGNASIEMNGGWVKGNVYGGGKYGLTGVCMNGDAYTSHLTKHGNTTVDINDGKVGVLRYTKSNPSGDYDGIVHVGGGGNVFGGGRGGDRADYGRVMGNTKVNIKGGHVQNNVYGGGEKGSVGQKVEYSYTVGTGEEAQNFTDYKPKFVNDTVTGYTKVKVTGGQVGPAPKVDLEHGYKLPIALNGVDGYVFGGGMGVGNDAISAWKNMADVNYACVEVDIPANADTTTNRIWGSLFGGAEDGHVLGSDTVLLVSGFVGTKGTTSYDGNIFGGGRNYFKKNYTAGRTRGNITVDMSGGHLFGSIFGGGRLAITGIDINGQVIPDVAANQQQGTEAETFGWVKVMVSGGKVGNDTPVTVSGTTMPYIQNFTKFSMGDVFGGGKGDMIGIAGHPTASALLISMVKNTEVEISGTAKIYGSVYGGGEVANVGEFTWIQNPETGAISNIQLIGNGHTKVTVKGGQIGAERMCMDYHVVGGSGNDKYNLKYNTDVGHVCGGGKGRVDNPNSYGTVNVIYPGGSDAQDVSILNVMATVNTTEVNIKGDAYVKGSVFGGAMNGHVLDSTYVLIEGGQIGAGKGETEDMKYTDNQFVDPTVDPVTASLNPTDHWVYGKDYIIEGETVKKFYPFDPILVYNDTIPSDGKTWFGNVYGGGSGYYPYIDRNHDDTADSTVWNRNAGMVRGNTRVEMTGGHVLSCVYGGCETTDVLGHATVILDGTGDNNKRTVGVPRIANDIRALPLPGYVYGSGNGDPRTNFNTWTNVDSTYVKFDNSVVYGCVFAGGMDGHVLRNTHVEVLGGTIGIFGTTGAEGNVFGGGRGSNPVALTAGGVGGNTQVDIKDGRMFGSIFGGGNNGSVGIQFLYPTAGNYGELKPDDPENNKYYGYTVVNISGGDIGHEDTGGRTGGNVYGGSRGTAGAPNSIYQRMAKVKTTHVNISEAVGKQTFIRGSVFGSGEDGHVLQDTYVTVSGGQIGGKFYTTGEPELCDDIYHGNVYGGGRGLDTYKDGDDDKYSITAGKVSGNTHVLVKGGRIVRNVYGGGNIASVGEYQADGTTPAAGTGLAQVTIKGGKIGVYNDANLEHGNVFGSSHGLAGPQYLNLAYVHDTEVRLDSVAIVYGAVFGGGEDGHVNQNTMVSVNGSAEVGNEEEYDDKGNVYGGGRGINLDYSQTPPALSPTAGLVKGHTRVYINDGHIYGSVYGGGHTSKVIAERVVNINGGTIERNVFGGGNTSASSTTYYTSMKTVNVRGGQINGNVFGGSYSANEGDPDQTPSAGTPYWTSFVNITGGTIGTSGEGNGNVYAAGYAGEVKGSVCINVGANTIAYKDSSDEWQPRIDDNAFYDDAETGSITPTAPSDKDLLIKGSIYGGSTYAGDPNPSAGDRWNTYDISGFSKIYVDGEGYNTANTTTPYMDIKGSLYGCGTHCESGKLGRDVFLRHYGQREETSKGECTGATRTLKSAQRISNLVIDQSNIQFSGYEDISGKSDSLYAVVKVKDNFYVANGSSMKLGTVNATYIDSIQNIHSAYLTSGTVYDNANVSGLPWGWIGIQADDPANPVPGQVKMYHITGTGSGASVHGSALTADQENVILFLGRSRIWVRYHNWEEDPSSKAYVDKEYYGELSGFFRMRADNYQPYGYESFAEARRKLTEWNDNGSLTYDNEGDGGFLSYNTDFNFHTKMSDGYRKEGDDGGLAYTNTKQYPYSNRLSIPTPPTPPGGKVDLEEYRLWAIPKSDGGRPWYVDGRPHSPLGSGIGENNKDNNRGLFPDLPKLTICGDPDSDVPAEQGIYAGTYEPVSETESIPVYFNQAKDVIYVVGAVNSTAELTANSSGFLNAKLATDKPLRLYRYPGGHPLSSEDATDPAPNYHAMIEVNDGDALTLNKVVVDGLFGYEEYDPFFYTIPASFVQKDVDMPLVIAHGGSTLTLCDSTTLKNGYNKTDAELWYANADYEVPANVYHGGGLFVDAVAVVNVKDSVYITGNKQYRSTEGWDHPLECNVYLPTFNDSYLHITGALFKKTRIGVTSPKRNRDSDYHNNTFSPIAKATRTDHEEEDASNAWKNCNFTDDQHWFFANKNKLAPDASPRTTYYNETTSPGKDFVFDNTMLYFGWTWASVVRSAPAGFGKTNYIDSCEDLAWLITALPTGEVKQTADLDMGQYVWVPIGDNDHKFTGSFDGQGHLIKNLNIDYIGTGDARYERTDYGLFGNVRNATITRTFVVSGNYDPVVTNLNGSAGRNIGGLVGYMEGSTVVSSSEAAVTIPTSTTRFDGSVTGNNMGGLVGMMAAGEVHSSMAMPDLSASAKYFGMVGGLVGNATGGQVNNSFVNGEFYIHTSHETATVGGLLGNNTNADVKNCYVTWVNKDASLQVYNFGSLAATTANNKIDKCYVMENKNAQGNMIFKYAVNEGTVTNCNQYSPVMSADNLGYMYSDNVIPADVFIARDTAMFGRLNKWVDKTNKAANNHKYARWARPGLAYNEMTEKGTVLRTPINGDLPVLMLSEFDETNAYQGGFRSVGTYAGGPALQYGGTARDANELADALSRTLEKNSSNQDIPDYLFVYGDVIDEVELAEGKSITQSKVSIHEDASIKSPGDLASFGNTYVGISFDNSCGHAESTYGVNYGLQGANLTFLPRDWHMFSTPLSNAPMGFNYMVGSTNTNNGRYTGGDQGIPGKGTYYNNIWTNHNSEFFWLSSPATDECAGAPRYWMKEFSDADQTTDGYFPTSRGNLFTDVSDLFITGSDECPESGAHRYPYGMDFYAWTEPGYHWINFKRNGPNHWHSDEPHGHLDYVNDPNFIGDEEHVDDYTNFNEETLITAKGYLASITKPTFMESHGTLNADAKTIQLTQTNNSKLKGWNLVGNPYHGYIDFDAMVDRTNPDGLNNYNILSKHDNTHPFYVVYDADTYQDGHPGTGFLYRPALGSRGGEYAGNYIHPHQGFYVKLADGMTSETLKFNENMLVSRSTIKDGHFRKEELAYPLVNLYLSSDNGCADVTVIEFERPEWGGATKLKELRVGNGLFYAHHGDNFYAALFAEKGIDRVPVWFEAKEDDIFTLKWNTANGDFQSMYLIDNITGVQYDMLRNDTYVFEGHKNDYWSRFLIVFNVTDVDEHEVNNFVFFDGSEYVVTGEGDLEFIDVLGHVLMHTHVDGGQTRVRLPKVAPALYFMRLTNGKECMVQKIVVK